MMKSRTAAGRKRGSWDGLWIERPVPAINEPHKAMCRLTPDDKAVEDRKSGLCLGACLAHIDNVFMKRGRLFSAFERTVGTPDRHNTVWRGCAPCTAQRQAACPAIFRAANNFALAYEDLLWAGERAVKAQAPGLALPCRKAGASAPCTAPQRPHQIHIR